MQGAEVQLPNQQLLQPMQPMQLPAELLAQLQIQLQAQLQEQIQSGILSFAEQRKAQQTPSPAQTAAATMPLEGISPMLPTRIQPLSIPPQMQGLSPTADQKETQVRQELRTSAIRTPEALRSVERRVTGDTGGAGVNTASVGTASVNTGAVGDVSNPIVGGSHVVAGCSVAEGSKMMMVSQPQTENVRRYELTTNKGDVRVVEKIELLPSPRIELLRSFLSAEECETLNDLLAEVDQIPHIPNNLLASEDLQHNLLEKWIGQIVNRIAQICDVPDESIVGLCPSVVHKGAVDATKEFSTIIRIYLDEPQKTAASSDFPDLGLSITPKLGAALRWDCKDQDGSKTQLTKHKEILVQNCTRRFLTAYLI
ncbi:hypothetical protein GNI_132180 [Gregarina niphandrodes]|uniref:Uncharacterized protein n=1 Tax=Gregarina niphandrodes TaxID=110365 RepID=A0A023B1Z2_GRENI|nr:hypothetical protein GNI_132180 [Gregarina niphandrodes]EZG47138.1 hypothetical protein GNI_132180 [Gregarina niphandrodes]|eukprot:XP_011132204.1 hypothetical protein GNI_132180 [Gregarina niphandrodes]